MDSVQVQFCLIKISSRVNIASVNKDMCFILTHAISSRAWQILSVMFAVPTTSIFALRITTLYLS